MEKETKSSMTSINVIKKNANRPKSYKVKDKNVIKLKKYLGNVQNIKL